MGIIKAGSVSGKLPTNKVFAVHYPAYPSSVERAVETLGGIQGIAKVLPSLLIHTVTLCVHNLCRLPTSEFESLVLSYVQCY